MSKETYMRGFCKAAAARGVDPAGLAAMTKQARLTLPNALKLLKRFDGGGRPWDTFWKAYRAERSLRFTNRLSRGVESNLDHIQHIASKADDFARYLKDGKPQKSYLRDALQSIAESIPNNKTTAAEDFLRAIGYTK
jgi:hypothetical protein